MSTHIYSIQYKKVEEIHRKKVSASGISCSYTTNAYTIIMLKCIKRDTTNRYTTIILCIYDKVTALRYTAISDYVCVQYMIYTSWCYVIIIIIIVPETARTRVDANIS